MKQLISLLILASFSVIIWIFPQNITGWGYSSSLQASWLIIPFVFWIWLIWINRNFAFRHILGYPVWIAVFIFYIIVHNLSLEYLLFQDIPRTRIFREYSFFVDIIIAISFPFVITFLNNRLAKFEKRWLKKKEIPIMFVATFSILLLSLLLTLFFNGVSYLLFNRPDAPLENSLHPAYWLENGSLIFSLIIFLKDCFIYG